MKKMFLMMLAVVLSLSCSISAFADGEAYFDALGAMNGNYEASMEITMSVDKPLEILDVLADFLEGEMSGNQQILGLPANLRILVESIFDTTSKMDIKASVSKDYKKMAIEMSGETIMPLKFGENLKNTTEAKQKIWMELDFSDMEKPVYRVIQINPFLGDKYVVMDMGEILGEEMKMMASLMNVILSEEGMELIRNKSVEAIKAYAQITSKGGNTKLVFDDKATKGYIMEIMDIVIDIIKTMAGESLTELDAVDVKEIFAPIMDINIFGDEGIVIDTTVKSGKLSTENVKFSIDANLYDIIAALEPDALAEDFFITRENSNIAFSVNAKTTYKSVNKDVKITFPVLTKENSVNMAENLVTSTVPEISENYEEMTFPAYYAVVKDGYPIEAYGKDYLPVRALFGAYGVADEDIAWDNGTIYVKSNGACEYFNEISFVCGEAKAVKDGTEILLSDVIINYEGQTCVSAEFVEKVLGGKITSIYFYASEYHPEKTTEYTIEHFADEIVIPAA